MPDEVLRPSVSALEEVTPRDVLERRARAEVRLFTNRAQIAVLVGAFAIYVVSPLVVNDLWAHVLALAGILALGALGLNLLTGWAGQASLGTAAFVAIGAFTTSYLGRAADLGGRGQPFVVYLVVAMACGAGFGLVVGLPALRLRGPYLVIVTLGLVFLVTHLLVMWTTVSNGNSGAPSPRTLMIGDADFRAFDFFGLRATPLGDKQSLMYVVWGAVAIAASLMRNIARTRPGRALQAVRDRDLAAEVVGISMFRYKVGAFVISSALASAAGVFFAHYQQFIRPDPLQFGLSLSVTFLAVIVIGGVGTVSGTAIGALVVGSLPVLIQEYGAKLPIVTERNVVPFADVVVAAALILMLVLNTSGITGLVVDLRQRGLKRSTFR